MSIMDMRDFLKKEDRRQLEIVEKLYYTKNGVDTKDLQELTGVTHTVLANDVKLINERAQDFEIVIEMGRYRLVTEPTFALDSVYTYVLKEATEAKFLNLLFEETCQTKVEAAEELFMSQATFHRMHKKLEAILSSYQVTIASRPLRLIGNEVFIRYLFTLFYNQQRKSSGYFFSDSRIDQKLFQLVANFIQDNSLKETYYIHDQLFYSACVGLTREKLGHSLVAEVGDFFQLTPRLEEKIAELAQLPYFHGTFDITKAFWAIYQDYLILSIEQFNHAVNHNQRLKLVYLYAESYLSILKEATGVRFTRKRERELLARFCNENYIYRQNSDFISVFRSPRREFVRAYEAVYPEDIRLLKGLIRRFEELHALRHTADQIENQLYVLLTSIPELMNRIHPVIKVMVLSDITWYHSVYLANNYKRHFPENVHFDILQEIFAEDEAIFRQFEKYDLLVTTFSLPEMFSELNILTVKPLVNFGDLERIHQRLLTIAEKKFNAEDTLRALQEPES